MSKLLFVLLRWFTALLIAVPFCFLGAAITPEPDNDIAAYYAIGLSVFATWTTLLRAKDGKDPRWLVEFSSPVVGWFLGVYCATEAALILSGWSFVVGDTIKRPAFLLPLIPACAVVAWKIWRDRSAEPTKADEDGR